MLFHSIEFAIFLPIVFILYWLVLNKNLKWQNFFLLVVSYIFYGWWDWRFLTLIVFSSFVDYFTALNMSRSDNPKVRKAFLWMSLVSNLGLLGFFKYFNFFIDSFAGLIDLFGLQANPTSLNLILPVGISFYTFQTLSYTIDVYRGKMSATKDFVAFFSYVSFFPQLVAGPIERASNLLPQFFKKREFTFEKGRDGLRQILWGLFKKVVIADTCAIYANDIFQNYQEYSSLTLLLGAIYFTFQIYGDFSGYSDIAIGTAKLFGFDLMRNFAYPYFSRDIAEFWRRWHISLSTWFRDYVYIPLGGSRGSMNRTLINVLIIFVVSGFWHGANWTFIAWGALNGLYFIPLLLTNRNRSNLKIVAENRIFPNLKESTSIFVTFTFTVFAWIFFRAESMNSAIEYIINILHLNLYIDNVNKFQYLPIILLLLICEWFMRGHEHPLVLTNVPMILRWIIYGICVWLILFYYGQEKEFIYFQF